MKIHDDKERFTVAGTGHRPQKLNPQDLNDRRFGFSEEAHQILLETARQSLSGIQAQHPGKEIEVISGVALGFDQALAEAALEKNMRVIAAVPFEGQEKAWRPDSQRRYFELLEKIKLRGGEVHVVSPGGYSAAKMQARNIWMVDRADLVLALHSGFSGGTANCIEYAKDQGKDINNIWQAYTENVRQFREGRATENRSKNSLQDQIDVVHVNTFRGERDESFIYIGREMPSHGLAASPLANPYHIGPDGSRREVIEKYYGWLRQEFKNLDSPARAELLRIKGLVEAGHKVSLACWCAPQNCHGEVIRESVIKLIERDKTQTRASPSPEVHARQTAVNTHGAGEPILVTDAARAAGKGGDESRDLSTDRSLSNRTIQAHLDILGNNNREDMRALYEVTDGMSRAEHASKLNETNVEARDAFERGATIYGDTLVIPKEFDSLPRETIITTRQHAFALISEFVTDESLAKEKANELVELADQICGRWSDAQARLTIFQNLYDQITEDERGRPLPLSDRQAALEKTLETSRVWAAEMSVLEPLEVEEHALDDPLEPELDQLQLEAGMLHDENEVYAHLYEDAIERASELAQGADHVEVEVRGRFGGSALPETAYERISLSDLPPAIPDGITLEEEERLLTETLPDVDRAIESGVSRDEIMRGIYAAHAREERDGHGAKVLASFAAVSVITDRSGGATRSELLQAYTTLRVLVSEELEKELSRISLEALRDLRPIYAASQQSQEQQPSKNVDERVSAASHSTTSPAREYYVEHEKEIRVSQQKLLRLDRVPTRNTIERIETLEQALQNIDGAIQRLGATEHERIVALDMVGARAHSVITAENERLSSYEKAEALRSSAESPNLRPLEFQSIREHLEDERAQAIDEIAKVRGDYLMAMGFIPDSPEQAKEFVAPYLSGVERTSEIISESRNELGAAPVFYEAEKVGPVYVSLAGRSTVRLPLGSVQEHRALVKVAEACKLPVMSWHGLYGKQIDGRSESCEQVARFISNYIDFRLKDAETRLLNESVEYRVYAERLASARTIEELRAAAKDIRRDNYTRSQQIKAHQQDPERNPLPPRLDPAHNARPRALTSYEMRQLFISTAPAHYTDEMREYRQGLSISGREKEKRVDALARGEITPSKQLSTLLEELEGRKPTPEALAHYTKCLTTPADKMLRPASFDLHAVHEQLLPYERDYLFRVLSEKRDALRGRSAHQQEHSQTLSHSADERAPERSTVKELSASEIFRSYYAASRWREAELFSAEMSRRGHYVSQSERRSSIVQGVSDRNLEAAGYVLHNFDSRQAQDVAAYLRASSDRQTRATGEIIQAFSEIKQDVKHDGRIELSLTVPQQSRFGENDWKALLNHFHPDNRANNNFLRSKLPEGQIPEIRRDAQVQAWAELEPHIRATSYSPDSRAEVLYSALDVKEALNATRQLQTSARTAHYALEGHITSCARDVERRLAEPGKFLSNRMALSVASHTARVGSYAASFAGQREIANALAWTSARLKESSAASGHVEAQGGTERTAADRETTRELVKAAIDPEYAKANADFVNEHANEYHFIRHVITPRQEKTYRELKSFAAKSKQKYLKSFLELDKKQQELSSARELDAQQRSQADSQEREVSDQLRQSQAQKEFQREFASAERQLVGERIESMIRDKELPDRSALSAEQSIRDLLPVNEQQALSELARESAWWNMVPPEVRGESFHDDRTSAEVVDRALEVSDAVSTARDAEKELLKAKTELASFLSAHANEGDRQNASRPAEARIQEMADSSAHAQLVGQTPEEQRALTEQLLQTLGNDDRAALEQLTERVAQAEANLDRAFTGIDKTRGGLELAREEQLMEERVSRFNEVRQPLEERMTQYLNEALRMDGIDAFRDQTLSEHHTYGLSEAMRDCVEDHEMTLDDLNLRTEDVQEIARDLISSVATTLEHSLDHTVNRDIFTSGHDFSNNLSQSIQMLDAADSRLGMDHDQTMTELTAHEISGRRQEQDAHDLSEEISSGPRSIDKEQTEGVRGMDSISTDQERVSEHLEHAREVIQVFSR